MDNMNENKFENLSYNDMPQAIEYLISQVSILSKTVQGLLESRNIPEKETWMTVDDVAKYLPDNPSVQTIYSWVGQKLIPYNKIGKRLYFLKSEIDAWLKNGRRKTAAEIAVEASTYFEKQHSIKKK